MQQFHFRHARYMRLYDTRDMPDRRCLRPGHMREREWLRHLSDRQYLHQRAMCLHGRGMPDRGGLRPGHMRGCEWLRLLSNGADLFFRIMYLCDGRDMPVRGGLRPGYMRQPQWLRHALC